MKSGLSPPKDLRPGGETSENQTVSIIYVQQHTATFPSHSRILNPIVLIVIFGRLRHFGNQKSLSFITRKEKSFPLLVSRQESLFPSSPENKNLIFINWWDKHSKQNQIKNQRSIIIVEVMKSITITWLLFNS